MLQAGIVAAKPWQRSRPDEQVTLYKTNLSKAISQACYLPQRTVIPWGWVTRGMISAWLLRFLRGLGTDKKSLLQVDVSDAGQSDGIAGMSSTLFVIPQTCRNSTGLCNGFQEIFLLLGLSFPGFGFCQRWDVVKRMN